MYVQLHARVWRGRVGPLRDATCLNVASGCAFQLARIGVGRLGVHQWWSAQPSSVAVVYDVVYAAAERVSGGKWLCRACPCNRQLQEAAQEARVLAKLKHRNIVEFIGICITPPDVCLVFELCELGDLRHLLDSIVKSRQGATSRIRCDMAIVLPP